ncbi:hypothetical protein BKA65DRAFT_364958, partial [Rhexocercosporidium sp. MPI-PUGE-AT-0058]
ILGASRQSLLALIHWLFATHFPSDSRYFWFFVAEMPVAANKSSNSSLSGIARLRILTGLNPPSRSPTSLC